MTGRRCVVCTVQCVCFVLQRNRENWLGKAHWRTTTLSEVQWTSSPRKTMWWPEHGEKTVPPSPRRHAWLWWAVGSFIDRDQWSVEEHFFKSEVPSPSLSPLLPVWLVWRRFSLCSLPLTLLFFWFVASLHRLVVPNKGYSSLDQSPDEKPLVALDTDR